MNMDYIDQTIEDNHKIAFRIIQYFFSGSDILIILLNLCMTKFYFNRITKIFILMVLDILIRAFELYTYSIQNSFVKDLFLAIVESCQFVLIISHINKGFANADNYVNKTQIGSFEYILFTSLFSLIIFPFEKYFIKSNTFYICKHLVIFVFLFFFYQYLMNRYKIFLISVSDLIQTNILLDSMIKNMPCMAYFTYSLKCFVKISTLFVKNKLYSSYLDMGIITLNELGKYSIFVLLGALLYIFESEPYFINKNYKYDVSVNNCY